MNKQLTLCIPVQGQDVLLGMKKRGFGAGRWNGFGGKLEQGETIEDALFRELHEEVGLIAKSALKVGVLNFQFVYEDLELEVHVFIVKDFAGVPKETEEMRPQWFSREEVPYSEMWPDDELWFPLMLAEKRFTGSFLMDRPSSIEHTSKIISYGLHEMV